MTQRQQLLDFLEKQGWKPFYDDCLASRLGFSQRQTAFQITNALDKETGYSRKKNSCSLCGGFKFALEKKTLRTEIVPTPPSEMTEPLESEAVTAPDNASVARLTDIGFNKIGEWVLVMGRLELQLEAMHSASPALYAFVEGQNVLYVGKTAKTLKQRLYLYSRPGPSQRTNVRLHDLIENSVRSGKKIDIYGFSSPISQKVGEFELSIPAALEDDIIRKLKPEWNHR